MCCIRLNGDLAVLPLAVPLDGSFTNLEPHTKEDFQKMLTEWQEHLGSLQVSEEKLKIIHQNAQYLRNKIELFTALLQSTTPDILAISDHGLKRKK
jgi:hypothetical protein